jgi:type I site-specific restriction endonuclease
MDKRSLTERDICTKFILPAVKRAGALIEAKDNNHSVGHGIQQGLDYANAVGVSADRRADFLFDAAQQAINDCSVAADLNQPVTGAELRLVDDH